MVLFDDPHDPSAGWCATARPRETYRRISGPSELPTDTIWWSNIPYQTFFVQTEVWRQPNLRHQEYHVVTPQKALTEWGYDPKAVQTEFACKFLAVVFDRLMRCAWKLLREVNPKLRLSEAFLAQNLREDLRPCIPDIDYPKGEAASVVKSGIAYEEFTPTGAKGQRGSQMIMLRKPRVDYSMEMLQTPVPRGPYQYLARRDLRERCTDPVRHVLDSEKPMMVDVSVTIQPEVASIYGFGASTNKGKRTPRSWVAHPEFMALHRFADIQVRSIWEAEEYWAMVPDMPEAVKDFFKNETVHLSWTAGVVAETLWRTVALPEGRGRMMSGPGEDRASTSWAGAWLRAADKTAMFTSSLRLAELGYCVRSYGLGWVSCLVPEEETADFIREGLTLGFLPGLQQVPEGMFRQSSRLPWQGSKYGRALAKMTVSRNFNYLWNLDIIPLMPIEKQKSAFLRLEQMMGGRAKGEEAA